MEGAPPAPSAQLAWARALLGVAVHPELWPTAARQARVLTTPAWRRFRLETQYGDPSVSPAADDAVAWLRWCRSWRRSVPRPVAPRKFPSRLRARG